MHAPDRTALDRTALDRLLDDALLGRTDARRLALLELAARAPPWREGARGRGRAFLIDAITGLHARAQDGAPAHRVWSARAAIGGTLDGEPRLHERRSPCGAWLWPFQGTPEDEDAWLRDLALIEAAQGSEDADTRAAALDYDDALRASVDGWVIRVLTLSWCARRAQGREARWIAGLLTARFAHYEGLSRNLEDLVAAARLLESAPASASRDALLRALAGWAGKAYAGTSGIAALSVLARAGVSDAAVSLVTIATPSGDTWSPEERGLAMREVLRVGAGGARTPSSGCDMPSES